MADRPPLRARPATPNDYALYTRAFAELGVHDPPRPRDRWLRDMLPSTLFYEENGRFVAYAFVQILFETGYVRNMVVAPEARGRGIAHQVMDDLRARFCDSGCKQWCLNVRPDNVAAIRVYEDSGLREVYRSHAFRVKPAVIAQLPAPDPTWTIRALPPAEDTAIEQAFGIDRGLIGARRRSREVRVLAVRDSNAVLGVVCYDVERNANPFAVRSVAVAHALFRTLQPMAADREAIHIMVQADPALDHALETAGAEVLLAFAHYRGSFAASSRA